VERKRNANKMYSSKIDQIALEKIDIRAPLKTIFTEQNFL
jgi:hypothetical protein